MGYPDDLTALRERLTAAALVAVARELARQRREVAARAAEGSTLRGKAALGLRGPEAKAVFTVWAPEQLVPEWHATRLRRSLVTVFRRALYETHGLTVQAFGLRAKLTPRDVRDYLAIAGDRLVGVTATTQQAVRLALRDGLRAMDRPEQLAARLRALPEFGPERAATIARTETANATNWAAQTAYERDPRVLGVRFHDLERCAPAGGPCAGWNDRVLSVPEAAAAPLTFHPNCSQLRTPVLLPSSPGGRP